MEFLIVTGPSCSGKSYVVSALEEVGFYCADNLPPALIYKFYELCMHAQVQKVAVVTDIRSVSLFSELSIALDKMRDRGNSFKVLFIDCEDGVLLNRYKETRRKHPLTEKYESTEAAISAERTLLEPLAAIADYNVDTSQLSTSQLKDRITALFGGDGGRAFTVHVESFGFKYGMCREADLMFDVRCFKNPYYIPELKPLTGLDKPVSEYVLSFDETRSFLSKLFDMVDFLLPLYMAEGKSELIIGIGCTGGKHRSVTCVEALSAHLKENGIKVVTTHRDISKH